MSQAKVTQEQVTLQSGNTLGTLGYEFLLKNHPNI
jgi:hypothetical protein